MIPIASSLIIILLIEISNAVTTLNVFSKYTYNKIFVETGCFEGDGIALALKAGYEIIYSIELSDILYEGCRERFRDNFNVHIIKGDSAIVLRDILSNIDFPSTFWLDGHFSGCCNNAKGETNTPLLKELEAIGNHHIKNHTILIDDARDLEGWYMDFIGIDIVLQKLHAINSLYQIRYENGLIENDVIVASVDTNPSNHRHFSIDIYLNMEGNPIQFYFSAMDLESKSLMLDYCNKFCIKFELAKYAVHDCPEMLLNKSIEIYESRSTALCQGNLCSITEPEL